MVSMQNNYELQSKSPLENLNEHQPLMINLDLEASKVFLTPLFIIPVTIYVVEP